VNCSYNYLQAIDSCKHPTQGTWRRTSQCLPWHHEERAENTTINNNQM